MSESQSSNVFIEDDEDVSSQTFDEEENRLVDTASIDVSSNDTNGAEDVAMQEISLDQNLIKTVDKFICACYEQQWDVVEHFLSNANISLDEKKNILHFQENHCLKAVFGNGAPLKIIKALARIEGKQVVKYGTQDQPPWLHIALMLEETPFDVIKYYVNIGGKASLKIKSDFYCGGTALHIAVGGFGKQEIIELLLREGGLELLDITDGGGFPVLDYCDAPERETIVNCLVSIEKSPWITMQELVASLEHKKRFSTSAITPREVENWIHQDQLDLVRDYFNSTDVSEGEKIRCLNYRNTLNGRTLLHTYSSNCYPVEIVTRIVSLMGKDCLFSPDGDGNTCLHLACDSDVDMNKQNEFVKFLIDNTGADLIHEVNHESETALHKLISCHREVMNFELIQMMIRIGGEDLLNAQDVMQNSVLHHISMYALDGKEANKELLVYLVSKGGRKLRELTDDIGKKAEDYWTDDIKDFIHLSCDDLPSLSDDMQCPICFNRMNDVLIITRCFHRFCRKCIAECYHQNGNNCPIL